MLSPGDDLQEVWDFPWIRNGKDKLGVQDRSLKAVGLNCSLLNTCLNVKYRV